MANKEQTETGSAATQDPATSSAQAPAEGGNLPPFYKRPLPLHLKDHAEVGVLAERNYRFAAQTTAIPLTIGEFPAAARHYPVLFSPGAQAFPVALVGIYRNDNFFVEADGSWRADSYIPAYLRRYPFLLARAPEENRHILCVDEESDMVVKGGGEPLIEDGKASAVAERAMRFCESYARDHERTTAFTAELAGAGLLEEQELGVSLASGQKLRLKGFQLINPRKFEEMADDAFLDWRKKGWLFPIYCHFVAAQNWQRLAQIAAQRPAPAAEAQPADAGA